MFYFISEWVYKVNHCTNRCLMVVWYGIVWYCRVWYGMVWCGVVRCGVLWCGMVWCGMVWCGTVWYGVVWYGVVWWFQPSSKLFDHQMICSNVFNWWTYISVRFVSSSYLICKWERDSVNCAAVFITVCFISIVLFEHRTTVCCHHVSMSSPSRERMLTCDAQWRALLIISPGQHSMPELYSRFLQRLIK